MVDPRFSFPTKHEKLLSDGSKVFSVVLQGKGKQIHFETVAEGDADVLLRTLHFGVTETTVR